jgi:hypothetical protein
MALDKAIADALRATSTGTITTILLKKGIRRAGCRGRGPPLHAGHRTVGRALHPAVVPAREDLATPNPGPRRPRPAVRSRTCRRA